MARSSAPRLAGSPALWAIGLLLLASLVAQPVPLVAIWQLRQSRVAVERVWSDARLRTDVRRLRLAVAGQDAALRAYLASGDPGRLESLVPDRSRAAAAWSASAADARGAGLEAELPAVGASLDAWQAWADEQVRDSAGGRAPPDPAALHEGDRLLAAFVAASDRVDAAAGRDLDAPAALDGTVLRAGLLLGDAAIAMLALVLLAMARRPVARLAEAATALASGARTSVPDAGRTDEVGSLARALTRWRQAEVSRRAIVELSPIGLFTLSPDLQLVDANPAVQQMFGVPADDRGPAPIQSFVHPDDLAAALGLQPGLASGEREHGTLELRCVRRDGSVFWARLTVAIVREADGELSGYVGIVEDVSELQARLERAAQVQRDLLPGSIPVCEGYELAGLCRPSKEMGGDFYDWHRSEPGILTLTLGDVMGKDMPAALLMATVCVALRSAAALPTVGEALRSVAASAGRDLYRSDAFVTLFHSRLDLGTGVLTYVDAGHGLALRVGPAGVRRLARRASLPLGVRDEEAFPESSVRLEPGEALVVFSDGVLDVHPELEASLEAAADILAGATGAREMAERLASGSQPANDDVTVVVVRRTSAVAV